MTRRERVMAVVEGRKPDRTPSAFCLHFPSEQREGDAAVAAHLRFFEDTDGDICKIMNENLLRGQQKIENPADIAKERLSSESRKGIDAQVEMAKRIMDGLNGEGVALGTIHGPMVSIHHMSGREGFFVENIDFYRQCKENNPKALVEALKYATEPLCELTRRCVEEAGVDGIYYAALGGETNLFTDEEYAEYVRPFDLQVFEAAAAAPCFNLLHPCKKNISLARFADYPAEVMSWEIFGSNPSLEEGFELFQGKTVLGGLDNEKGPLIEGTREDIEVAIHSILRRAEGHKFILGANCTLPTGLDTARLRAAAQACATYAAD